MDDATTRALANAIKQIYQLRNHANQRIADRAKDIIRRARFDANDVATAVAAVQNTGLTLDQRVAALDELGNYIVSSGVLRRSS